MSLYSQCAISVTALSWYVFVHCTILILLVLFVFTLFFLKYFFMLLYFYILETPSKCPTSNFVVCSLTIRIKASDSLAALS